MAFDIFEHLVPVEAHDKLTRFKTVLFEQLRKGGGTFHKYISKSDKEYLTIDYTKLCKDYDNISPEPFLEKTM